MEYRVIIKAMDLFPYQKLYFTTLEYDKLKPVYCGENRKLETIKPNESILLVTGIASPKQIIYDLQPYTRNIVSLAFADHHQFNAKDIEQINEEFNKLPSPKIIITTEKDNTRLFGMKGLTDEVRHNMYILPVKIKFMLEQEEDFNKKIIDYVHKNSRNSILAKTKDEYKPQNSNNSGNRFGTISFRNNR